MNRRQTKQPCHWQDEVCTFFVVVHAFGFFFVLCSKNSLISQLGKGDAKKNAGKSHTLPSENLCPRAPAFRKDTGNEIKVVLLLRNCLRGFHFAPQLSGAIRLFTNLGHGFPHAFSARGAGFIRFFGSLQPLLCSLAHTCLDTVQIMPRK